MNDLAEGTNAEQLRPTSAIRQNASCLVVSLLIVSVLTTWFVATYHGPTVRSKSDSAAEFSAERSIQLLTEILGNQSPHEAGSAANDEVRGRLVLHLESLGLQVEQMPFEVNQVPMCNLLTSIPGDSSLRPVLLATHYDSVEQGPGAGDAGCCVAALLETARILNERRLLQPGAQLNRDIYVLLTDGEEWVRNVGHGLNGATHFVETQPHPLMERNPIVLNFDARGAAGPSLLYETSGNNLKLLKYVLPALPRPAFTASSYVTVYDMLPNATDFTKFKAAGLDGLNFAFIDDPHRYHTPEDRLEYLDHRSVQHHGENALAMTSLLLDSGESDFSAQENAIFFTVFNNWMICYPEHYAIPFAAVLLLVQLIATRLSIRRGATFGEIVATAYAIGVTVLISILCGWFIMQFDKYRPQSFHGFGPWDPYIVCVLWAIAAVSAWAVFTWQANSISTESAWACIWLSTAIVGLLTAIFLPGFSYLLFAIGVVPAVLSLFPLDKARMSVVAVAAASVFSIPLAYQFGIALGPKMGVVLSALFVLFVAPCFPLLVPRRP